MKHSSFALAAMTCALTLSSCTLLLHSQPKERDVDEEITPDQPDTTVEIPVETDAPPEMEADGTEHLEIADEEVLDADTDADMEADVCTPNCSGRECGDDECDGTCSPGCGAYETCNADGRCVSSIGITWVSIPAGSFDMGCSPGDGACDSYENPAHPVTVSGFEMTETEITQAQYLAVTGESPSDHTGCPDCPVEVVTWNQAKSFCEAIGGRLPSEAEWEYAARGGTATPWTCGDATSSCLGDIAWYDANAGGTTHPVTGKGVNGFGLYDMLGNVYEWVEDCPHGSYSGAPSTGGVWSGGACTYRVLRGGSWLHSDGNLRVSRRQWPYPDTRLTNLGFRCAKDAT